MRLFTVGAPPAVMMSPQSPEASAFVKLTAAALLQHPAVVELVVEEVLLVDEVDEVDEVEVDEVEVVDVDEVEVDDVDDVEDVELVLLVLLVLDVDDVDDVDVDEVDDVEVVVVPWTGHAPGAGASFRLKMVDMFLTVVPPNSAQYRVVPPSMLRTMPEFPAYGGIGWMSVPLQTNLITFSLMRATLQGSPGSPVPLYL